MRLLNNPDVVKDYSYRSYVRDTDISKDYSPGIFVDACQGSTLSPKSVRYWSLNFTARR